MRVAKNNRMITNLEDYFNLSFDNEIIRMKTRTKEEMLTLIIGFADADDRVRVVLMNGSRVNPSVIKDPFQDYDIANLVTDVEPFRDEAYVLPHFGEAIVVEQPLILFFRIFKKSALFVAERCGFRFPQEKSAKVLVFLKHIRTLPEDAERIY